MRDLTGIYRLRNSWILFHKPLGGPSRARTEKSEPVEVSCKKKWRGSINQVLTVYRGEYRGNIMVKYLYEHN